MSQSISANTREAALERLKQGDAVAAVALELNISKPTLRKWRDEQGGKVKAAPSTKPSSLENAHAAKLEFCREWPELWPRMRW